MTLEVDLTGSLSEQLRARIELRTARVAVIGLGYVGLPLAETFATSGYSVVGFDIDPEKIKKLRTGQSYIQHIDSSRIVELMHTDLFEPTSDPSSISSPSTSACDGRAGSSWPSP